MPDMRDASVAFRWNLLAGRWERCQDDAPGNWLPSAWLKGCDENDGRAMIATPGLGHIEVAYDFTSSRMKDLPFDFTDKRLGIPPDRMGYFARHTRKMENGEERVAVTFVLFPPIELRDATREQIEQVVMQSGDELLRGIVEEIYKAYTSEPIDPLNARLIGELLTNHADAMAQRKGS